MAEKRDNFNNGTKLILAQRVAYRCSAPSCPNKTIGPHHSNPAESMNLGEAAHIHAAAPLGPRYVKAMTTEERSSIQNGIWLCRTHARIIDLDEKTYTPELLRSWKAEAEAKAAKEMLDVQREILENHDTLICLDLDLMFTGVWTSAKADSWTFTVKDFLFGNIERLRGYENNDLLPMRRYIIIESQNEGRLIKEGFEWRLNPHDVYEITVQVYPPSGKVTLESLGSDIAHPYDGDVRMENGDFARVSGVDFAKQLIERNLGMPLGGWRPNQLMGSYFSMYYNQFHENLPLLNRLLKIELLRLMTIPTYQTEHDMDTELNFIKAIREVSVMQEFNGRVPLFLSLEWTNNIRWSDTLYVQLYKPEDERSEWEPPEFIQRSYQQPPLALLRKATSIFIGPELNVPRNNESIMRLFNETLPEIFKAAMTGLEQNIYPLFNNYQQKQSIDGRVEYWTSYDLELALMQRTVQQVGNHLYLKGFKNAGVDAFDIYADLYIYFEDYYYAIGGSRQQSWHKKLYDIKVGSEDIQAIAAQWINEIAISITGKINQLSH